MIRFILQRTAYGLLILWGVVTVVFFLFNLSPGDPVRNLVGENAPEEVVQNIRRKLDLDLPTSTRYFYYLNDLSPISFYTTGRADSRRVWEPAVHGGFLIMSTSSGNALVCKAPFFKRSFLSDRPVSEILAEAMPGTAVLAVTSIVLALLIGLALGVWAALRKDSVVDRMIILFSALGMAGPSFFLAILVAWLGAVVWRDEIGIPVIPLVLIAVLALRQRMPIQTLRVSSAASRWIIGLSIAFFTFAGRNWWNPFFNLPGTGLSMTGSLYSVNAFDGAYLNLSNLILPVITLAIRPLAVIVQLTRSSMLDVMKMDYIRTARAKGLSEIRVVVVHGLRNALNPVITAVSGWFASLLAGAVFVEFVFGWKGIGQEMFQAIEKQDLPVVMGGVILVSAIFVTINLFTDIAYGWADPRVRSAK